MRFLTLAVAWLLLALSPAQVRAEPQTLPRFDHVFVIILENHGFDDALTNGPAPFLRELAATQGLATRYFGVAHPSLPNYLALIGGDTFGVRDDQPSCHADDISDRTPCHRIAGESLADQLAAAGLTFAIYAESLPKTGALASVAPSHAEGELYAQKHNPFAYFDSFVEKPERLARMKPYADLTSDLAAGQAPNFALIVPDLCHDGHGAQTCRDRDQLIRDYDEFTQEAVAAIRASSAWTKNVAIVVTFDEGARSLYDAPPSEVARRVAGQDNHVATLVVTPCGAPSQDDQRYDHYSLLATIEDGFGLKRLRKAATAPVMTGLFARECAR